MADVRDNTPTKETLYALVGVVLFAGLVLLIGISAWVRPAMDDQYKTGAAAQPAAEAVATASADAQ